MPKPKPASLNPDAAGATPQAAPQTKGVLEGLLDPIPPTNSTGPVIAWDKAFLPAELGKRLAALRSERSLTQGELASLLGKSRTTVNQYEMGNISPPLQMVDEIAEALRIDPIFLAFGRNGPRPSAAHRLWLHKNGQQSDDFYEVSVGVRERLQLNSDSGCVIELSSDAPHFGLRRGDQIFVDPSRSKIEGDGKLYAVRSGVSELNLVRSEIQLEGPADLVRLTFGQGQVSEVRASKVKVVGLVRATLKLE